MAKPFVILTGNSGTGKTRISKQFAEYLEVIDINGEKNWLIVPVGADWTDNARVLGFYNPLADNGVGKYEKTGIIKLIERANDNPEIPYFLILDEMNLSHVERYFSDFLSHMETPDNPFELDGYRNKNDEDESTGKLPYPENLFVIGTVNRIGVNAGASEYQKALNMSNLLREFIKFSKHQIMFDLDSTIDILKNLLILRDANSLIKDRFAPVISYIIEMLPEDRSGDKYNVIGVVFKDLVDTYPEEAHFKAHLSRYYTHIEGNYQRGIEEAKGAIELSESQGLQDALLYHIAGMSMLFDEPTSALDPSLTYEVLELIRSLAQKHLTMIIVTHEMNFARQISDRIVFMSNGKILEIGTPNEIFLSPKHFETKNFIKNTIKNSDFSLL